MLKRAEKRNALNDALCMELGAAFAAAAADDSVRVLVLRGDGADVLVRDGPRRLARAVREPRRTCAPSGAQILTWWNLLEEMPKATIGQIHGGAIGGAFELALACDFRVMAEDAVAGIWRCASA